MNDEMNVSKIELSVDLAAAWLANPNNRTAADDVPNFLRMIHATLVELEGGTTESPSGVSGDSPDVLHEPAVSVRKSLASKDHIISMIDGKSYRTLRRHLSTNGLTPEEYRARYNLKADYPMVAPSYSEARRDMAKKIGLGRKPGSGRKKAGATKSE